MSARICAALWIVASGCSTALPAGHDPDLHFENSDLSPAENLDLNPCHPACSEGATRCGSDGKIQTCAAVAGCPAWSAGIACAAGQLCCGDTCVTADESNCFACGTVCSGPTPVCSTTLQRCTCTPQSCAASQHDCDSNFGICVQCVAPPVPETRSDFYVDGNASTSPTGSLGCPFGTISDALAPAGASTATNKLIHVAAGTYSNEVFPITLRGNVSIVGAGSDQTIIVGDGQLDHTSAGGALNYSVYATVVTGDPTRPGSISKLTVREPSPSPLPGHYGIFCDQGNTVQSYTNPPGALPTATTRVDSVSVGPGYDKGIMVTNSSAPNATGCNLQLTHSTLSGNYSGVWVVGCGQGVGKVTVSAQLGDSSGGGNQFLDNSDPTNNGYGVIIWDCSSPVSIAGNTFDGDNAGIAIGQHPRLDTSILVVNYITVDNNVFKNLSNVGISMGATPIIDSLTGNSFTNITTSLAVPAVGYPGIALVTAANYDGVNPNSNVYRPQIKRARNNSFIGNDIAIELRGSTPIVPDPDHLDTDFGTVGDAGNNVFRCNSVPMSSGLTGYDLFVSSKVNGGPLMFAGNQWDHAPPTSVSTGGAMNGTDLFYGVPSPQPVVVTDNSTVSTAMCPADRDPGP